MLKGNWMSLKARIEAILFLSRPQAGFSRRHWTMNANCCSAVPAALPQKVGYGKKRGRASSRGWKMQFG